jgi:DNA-binding transcriptional regulator LsrR (DeoR family)
MGITKREIASELGVSKRTVANYIEKLGLGNHVSRNGNTDFLDDFAAAAIADALKNPGKPSRQPVDAPAAPAPDSLVDSLAAQLEIERSRNAELMEALTAERDRAARAEAEAQLAEANAGVAELAGKLASLAERQQAIAATPWWRRGRMAMKLLGPGGE